MSLTEREKEIAIECLKESADHYDSVATIKAQMIWERGVDNFISRIRDGQEARKGYECVHCGMIYPDQPVSACDCLEAGQKQEFYDVVISRVTPAVPCDCSELVEVLENAHDVFDHLITRHRVVAGHQIVISCFERINNAISKHAKRMNGEME